MNLAVVLSCGSNLFAMAKLPVLGVAFQWFLHVRIFAQWRALDLDVEMGPLLGSLVVFSAREVDLLLPGILLWFGHHAIMRRLLEPRTQVFP